ncbi:Transcription elongation factor spt6, partial [Kickxella alabastrina]
SRFDARDPTRDADVFAADAERSARVVAGLLEQFVSSAAGDDAWDAERRDALFAAVRDHVLPLIWRETAQRLATQAFDVVADACRRALERRIDMQPPRTPGMAEGASPRVAVVAGGGFDASSRGALRVVVVDENGCVRAEFSADSMRVDDASIGGAGNGVAALMDAISAHAVNVVTVAGMSLQTRRLFDDVNAAVTAHGANVLVTYASDEAARLWCDSAAAREELPALRREERYCVAVARTLQDAPAAYASLGARVLSLPLHSAQRDVDQGALLAVVERAFVNVVNRVGVDVNRAAAHAHLQPALTFVAGLGPRKAQGIVARIGGVDRALESRNDLIIRNLITRDVFVNCVAFLRVRPATEPLDATLIHPEDYDLARKMALDALDIEDDGDDGRSRRRSDAPSRYVAEVMRRAPEKLDELELSKYADEINRLTKTQKLETLKFIRNELQSKNSDPRPEYVQPSDADVLHMMTGETVGGTLKEDGSCVVAATVIRVQPRFAIARLDSGLEGFIGIANVSDQRIDEVSSELAPGQAVVALVKRIDLEKMSLDLSIRPSDVSQAVGRLRQPLPDAHAVDVYFDMDAEAALRERAKAQQNKASARTRNIPHPLFKPLNAREAERYLAARPRGDCVIRPSSRGVDHIAVTWKVAEGLFQHIDVREEGKPSDAALGHTFIVGDSAYTDLDELVALHVDPIARKLDEVKRSPKFYDPEHDPLYAAEPADHVLGPNDFTEDYGNRRLALWDARITRHLDTLAQSTGRGAYCICLSLSKPGALLLAFKPTPAYRGITKWTARVEPNEYRLGDRGRYPDINGLIIGFKTMQMNPAALQKNSASANVRGEASSRRESSYRSSHNAGPSSSSRWGDREQRDADTDRYRDRDSRDRGREYDRDRDRDRDRGRGRDGDRDRARDRDRDHGSRDYDRDRDRDRDRNRDRDRSSRHNHNSAASGGGGGSTGWDAAPAASSSSHRHSSNTASASGWNI